MAREFAVTPRALRYYETRGLLQPRRRGRSRAYDAADRRRLQTILEGKQLGFTLTEIVELIGVPPEGADEADLEDRLRPEKIAEQLILLERRRDEIEAAIIRLRAARHRRSEPCAAV
jgi:DNA-binding transcriptional MerR regulator